MSRGRLEAFSDGVIAVLITILVLELKVPHEVDAAALRPMVKLKGAIQGDWKGKISILGYLVAVPIAFVESRISIALYAAVALSWLVPDRRIESRLGS